MSCPTLGSPCDGMSAPDLHDSPGRVAAWVAEAITSGPLTDKTVIKRQQPVQGPKGCELPRLVSSDGYSGTATTLRRYGVVIVCRVKHVEQGPLGDTGEPPMSGGTCCMSRTGPLVGRRHVLPSRAPPRRTVLFPESGPRCRLTPLWPPILDLEATSCSPRYHKVLRRPCHVRLIESARPYPTSTLRGRPQSLTHRGIQVCSPPTWWQLICAQPSRRSPFSRATLRECRTSRRTNSEPTLEHIQTDRTTGLSCLGSGECITYGLPFMRLGGMRARLTGEGHTLAGPCVMRVSVSTCGNGVLCSKVKGGMTIA